MQDKDILKLYTQRDEQAIRETIARYGNYCAHIAGNILHNREDVEECLNDTWNRVWNRIPPVIPLSLKAFLGKVVRDQALNKYRADHTAKRYAEFDMLLSELDECIPDRTSVEDALEEERLSALISQWIRTLKKDDQILFVRRYYHGESVKALAKEFQYSENRTSQRLKRLRAALGTYLKGEDVEI